MIHWWLRPDERIGKRREPQPEDWWYYQKCCCLLSRHRPRITIRARFSSNQLQTSSYGLLVLAWSEAGFVRFSPNWATSPSLQISRPRPCKSLFYLLEGSGESVDKMPQEVQPSLQHRRLCTCSMSLQPACWIASDCYRSRAVLEHIGVRTQQQSLITIEEMQSRQLCQPRTGLQALSSVSLLGNVLQGIFKFKQYQVVGRHLPTDNDPTPTVYRMRVWAQDAVRAKSKFW